MKKQTLLALLLCIGLTGCYSSYTVSPNQKETNERIILNRDAAAKEASKQWSESPAKPPPTPPSVEFRPNGIPKAPAENTKAAGAESIVKQLFSASMMFSVPVEANIDEDVKVQLIIDPTKEVAELEKSITVKGTKTGQTIKVSKVIIANISAPDFDVTKVTPEEQAVSDDSQTEWIWTLRPKSSGQHSINVTITAVVKVDDKERKHHIKTFEKTITIVIKPQQAVKSWAEEHWEWLFSTLIIPVGAWAWNKKK